MLRVSPGRTLVLLAAVTVTPGFASRTHRAPTSGHTHASLAHRARRAVAAKVNKIRGQREIDPQRATEIQTALIREKYLSGTPSGQWDAETEGAMQKFQADHGWQTRLTPDSRALIKLGLGPNAPAAPATTAATTAPAPSQTTGSATAAGAATAGSSTAAEPGTLASVHSVAQ